MSKKSKICSDELGLYVISGGYVARPVRETQFKEGDAVIEYHSGGSPLHGVGKDETCGRGEYLEVWMGCGEARGNENLKETYDFYMNLVDDYPGIREEGPHKISDIKKENRKLFNEGKTFMQREFNKLNERSGEDDV